MTPKDREILSAAIRAAREAASKRFAYESCGEESAAVGGADTVAEHIADALARESAAFDRERFLRDCGLPADCLRS